MKTARDGYRYDEATHQWVQADCETIVPMSATRIAIIKAIDAATGKAAAPAAQPAPQPEPSSAPAKKD